MNTPTPTPITEAHVILADKVAKTCDDDNYDRAAQLIADSEARAIAKQINALAILTLRWDKVEKEQDQLRARAEKAEAAETVALSRWNGALERAIKAEADLAALAQCHDDNCRALVKIAAELTAEQARLDWLESDAGVDWQWSSSALTIRRAVIDAAMKEGAK